jgi:hypothetical protein
MISVVFFSFAIITSFFSGCALASCCPFSSSLLIVAIYFLRLFLISRFIRGFFIRKKVTRIYRKNMLKKLVYEAQAKLETIVEAKEKAAEAELTRQLKHQQLLEELKRNIAFDEEVKKKELELALEAEEEKAKVAKEWAEAQEAEVKRLQHEKEDSFRIAEEKQSSISSLITEGEKKSMKAILEKKNSDCSLNSLLPSMSATVAEKRIDRVEITFDEYLKTLDDIDTSSSVPQAHDNQRAPVDTHEVIDFVERFGIDYQMDGRINWRDLSSQSTDTNCVPLPLLPNPRFSRPDLHSNLRSTTGDAAPAVTEQAIDYDEIAKNIYQSSRFSRNSRQVMPSTVLIPTAASNPLRYSNDDFSLLLSGNGTMNGNVSGNVGMIQQVPQNNENKRRPKSADCRSREAVALSTENNFSIPSFLPLHHLPTTSTTISRPYQPSVMNTSGNPYDGQMGMTPFENHELFTSQQLLINEIENPTFIPSLSPTTPSFLQHPSYQFAQDLYFQKQQYQKSSKVKKNDFELYGNVYPTSGTGAVDQQRTTKRPSSASHPKKSSLKKKQEKKKHSITRAYLG